MPMDTSMGSDVCRRADGGRTVRRYGIPLSKMSVPGAGIAAVRPPRRSPMHATPGAEVVRTRRYAVHGGSLRQPARAGLPPPTPVGPPSSVIRIRRMDTDREPGRVVHIHATRVRRAGQLTYATSDAVQVFRMDARHLVPGGVLLSGDGYGSSLYPVPAHRTRSTGSRTAPTSSSRWDGG